MKKGQKKKGLAKKRRARTGTDGYGRTAAKKLSAKAKARRKLLEHLAGFGAGNASIAEVEHELGFEAGGLEKLFAADAEAAQAFNNARLKTIIKLRAAIVDKVEAGQVTPTTMRQIEAMLRKEVAKKSIDYHRIPLSDMVELTRVSRQTIANWVKDFGLHKNSDETYDLFHFIEWFEGFIKAKIAKEPGKFFTKGDDLDRVRADKIRTELRRQAGDLLDRGEVMSGQLSRLNNFVEMLNRSASDLPLQIEHQSAERISEVLTEFFMKLRQQMAVVPDELRLEDDAAELYAKLLEMVAVKL